MKQRRGIRRFIIRTGIFLLLGAIVNIAVAWGCQLAFESNRGNPGKREQYQDWEVWTSQGVGAVFIGSAVGGSPASIQVLPGADLPTWSRLRQLEPFVRTERYVVHGDGAFGWPSLSLLYSIDTTGKWGEPAALSQSDWFGCIPLINLALRPIWPGFAINTLFYAAILWLLLALPVALRRWRRSKRGLCPACAYPVGPSNLCTECGMPVTRRPQGSSAAT